MENKKSFKGKLKKLFVSALLVPTITLSLLGGSKNINAKQIRSSFNSNYIQMNLVSKVLIKKDAYLKFKNFPASKENIEVIRKNATELFSTIVVKYKRNIPFNSKDINVLFMLFENFDSKVLSEIYVENEINLLFQIYREIKEKIKGVSEEKSKIDNNKNSNQFSNLVNDNNKNSNEEEKNSIFSYSQIKRFEITPRFIGEITKNKSLIYSEIFNKYKKKLLFTLSDLNILFTIVENININVNLKNIFSKQEINDLTYIYNVTKKRISLKIFDQKAKEFYSNNIGNFNEDISRHVDPEKLEKVFEVLNGVKVLNFVKLNENFSANLYKQCLKYNINYQLISIIALIENNFGNLHKSSSGAKGYTQVKDLIRKKYFPRDSSNWAYLVSTFRYLKDNENLLGINISNLTEISPVDLVKALMFYHDGLTNILNNPETIFSKSSEGLTYVKKGLTIYERFKLGMPTKLSYDKKTKTFKVNEIKII